MPTLKELLEKGESFKYGTDYRKVEADKDTLVEFETQGIRPKFTIEQPLLYGTQTLRITRRSTNILDDMKESRNNQGGSLGLLGGVVGKAKETLGNLASKIGIPEYKIPTRVSTDNDFIKVVDENQFAIPVTLAKIKKDGEGSIVGKFLQQNAQGTPKQVGRQAIGGAIGLAKSAARDAIFGVGGEPDLSPTIKDTLSSKEDGSLERFYLSGNPYSSRNSNIRGEEADSIGLYQTLFDIQGPRTFTGGFLQSKKDEQFKSYSNPQSEQVQPSFPSFPEFSVNSLTQNIPGKRDKTNKYTDVGGIFNNVEIINETNDGSDGKFRTKSDTINLSDLYTDENDTSLDNYDFLPLRFYSIGKQQGVAFKATVNGISENFSPAWEGSNFIGNPYTFYTYQTMDRDLTFSFSVYALSAEEHKKNWEKLDFLTSLVYPQNQRNSVYVTPPLLKVTLGNMYKNKLGFIESLSYTIDDNTPWEIGLGAEKTGNRISNVKVDNELKNYKLPTIINVAVSYQIIETSSDVVGKKLYPYGTSMIYGEK